MNKIAFFITFLLLSILSVPRLAVGQSFVKTRPFYIQKFNKEDDTRGFERCFISSPFAKSRLQKDVKLPDLKRYKVLAIDYYYTQYRSAKSFQQVKLDEQRFKQLSIDYPSIHALVDSVPVRFIEQVLAKTKNEARFYYHGFVVHFHRDPVSPKDRNAEIRAIDKLFDSEFKLEKGLKPGDIKELKGVRENDVLEIWRHQIEIGKPDATILVESGDIETQLKEIAPKDMVTCYVVSGNPNGNKVRVKLYYVPAASFPGSNPPAFVEGMFGIVRQKYEDSKLRFLAKRKFRESNELSGDLYSRLHEFKKDSLILVVDVTGSMGNSIAQVLKWVNSIDQKRIKGYVFFNDGDSKDDNKKRIGSTGGMYHCNDFSKVRTTLIKAMKRGSGGDPQENDMEAVLHGQKIFGDGNILLVADNIAHPRDLPLMNQVNAPIHLLLCNGMFAKNYYLNIKNKTKGSIINVLPKQY